MWLTAPGMDANNIHTACPAEGPCLPIGIHNEDTISQGMEHEVLLQANEASEDIFSFLCKPVATEKNNAYARVYT